MSGPQFHGATSGWLTERYAAGHMNEEEERDFEIAMLERPDLAAEVEAALGLRAGMRQLQARNVLDTLLQRRARSSMWHYRLAAVVLLFIAGGVLFVYSKRPAASLPILEASISAPGPGSHAGQNISTLMLVHTRSRAEPTTPSISRRLDAVVLRILPELPGDDKVYQVMLERADGNTTVPFSPEISVQAEPDGFLSVYINPKALSVGSYQVTVAQRSHRETFAIRVVNTP